MRILVTGAEGYIGRHLVPKLQEAGHYVIPLCNWPNEPHVRRYVGGPEKRWFCDLSKGFGELIEEKPPDTVIHLAGRVDISLLPNPKGADLPPVPGPCDIARLYRDNVVATINVLNYCQNAGVKHLVFASSQSVYGMGDCDEYGDPFFRPLEHYAASKLAAENAVALGASEKLSVSILRIGGVYGEDRKSGLVYRMLMEATTSGMVTVNLPYPLPLQVIHVDDAVDAICAATVFESKAVQRYGVWDIVHEENCSVNLLAAEVADLVPGCRVERNGTHDHPVMWRMADEAPYELSWHPKPRKERLAQVLEEIRSGR